MKDNKIKFNLTLEQIVFDMVDMGIHKVEDIMQYGFNKEESKKIQQEIYKR